MALFWHLVCFIAFLTNCVLSDNPESNPSKTVGRDDDSASHQTAYESISYPTQSLHNSNGYNGNQSPVSLSESNSAQIYGSGHQTNDQNYDQKERKTLILAIPVKLKLPNSEQDNYDQSPVQSDRDSDGSQIQSQSLQYSKGLSYQSPFAQLTRQPSYMSSNSEEGPISAPLPPLSHKIYSSIDSQLKSASYSTVNTQKSVSEQSSSPSQNQSPTNDQKYKNPYEIKDHKINTNQYVKDTDYNREYPVSGEYKGMSVKTESVDSDYETVDTRPMVRPNSGKSGQIADNYDDSFGARLRQREKGKHLYESIANNKPEYDYDSGSEEEEEEDDKKVENIYYSNKDYRNNKNGFNSNVNKNQFHGKPVAQKSNISPHSHHNHKGLGQSLPVYSADFDGWPQYYYSKPNLQFNDWSGIPENVDSNLLNLNLFSGFKLNNPVKDNLQNLRTPMYAPAFDLLADGQLKAASNPVPMKTLQNSKIYGQAAKYQTISPSLKLFAGQPLNIRDYGIIDLNGDLYPAPIVGQTPPRKAHNPLKQKELLNVEYNSGIRDSIKPHRRNPLLLRPSFMSGLRSAATKPLANYSPFASASSTQSFLSVLPSLQTSFNINAKSIPRQIFPLLYG